MRAIAAVEPVKHSEVSSSASRKAIPNTGRRSVGRSPSPPPKRVVPYRNPSLAWITAFGSRVDLIELVQHGERSIIRQ